MDYERFEGQCPVCGKPMDATLHLIRLGGDIVGRTVADIHCESGCETVPGSNRSSMIAVAEGN